MIQIWYENVDITNWCDIRSCNYIDASSGSDYVELVVDNTSDFINWGPRVGDRLRALCDTAAGVLDTGDMLVDTVMADAQGFSIYAASMPEKARREAYEAYTDTTLGDIAGKHAAELGLACEYYGIDPIWPIPAAIRDGETMAGFLTRIMTPQTGAVKYTQDRMALISRKWAAEQRAYVTIDLNSSAANFDLISTLSARYGRATVITPYAKGTARADGIDGPELTICDAPVHDSAAAAAWAAGALYMANAGAVTLQATVDTNAAIHVLGHYTTAGAIAGDWLADRVEHDMINMRTRIDLVEV